MKRSCFLPLFVTLAAAPVFAADITVGSPVNGTHIASPALIKAHNIGCDSVPPSSFGYSIDDATGLVLGSTAYDIDVPNQAIPNGVHTVHFKSWTARGECPTVNSTVTVTGSNPGGPPGSIPSYAIASGNLDGAYWGEQHDGGTPGSSRGSTVYPAAAPVYGNAREFYMTYSDLAGERWFGNFGHDVNSTYFVLDTYVLLPNPSAVLNLELDLNTVPANDETYILSTQCAGTIGQWEYGYTAGNLDHWWATGIHCDPRQWKANVWHHIQIGEHREANGYVTHDWITLDGVQNVLHNATKESAHFLHWEPGILNMQVQIEGSSTKSSSATAFIHNFTVYRWVPR